MTDELTDMANEIAQLRAKLAEAERQWHHWEDMYGVALAECLTLKWNTDQIKAKAGKHD